MSAMDISGIAIVTGGASGIGYACARQFVLDGARAVILLDYNASSLQAATEELEKSLPAHNVNCKISCIAVDVTQEHQVNSAINQVQEAFGRIDYVVNAAGVAKKHEGGAAFAQTVDWQRVLDVNLTGTFLVLRAAAQVMLKQEPLTSVLDGRPLQKGSIVNIASVLGLVAVPMSTAYTASKHGVIGLTRTASEDYARQGLRINAVCPGYIDTPMLKSSTLIEDAAQQRVKTWCPMGRFGHASEIAHAVVFLSSGRASFITGSPMVVDGGYTQH